MSEDDWAGKIYQYQTVPPMRWTRLLGTNYEVLLTTDRNVNLRHSIGAEAKDDFAGVRLQFGIDWGDSRAIFATRVPGLGETPLQVGQYVMVRTAAEPAPSGTRTEVTFDTEEGSLHSG
jgi:hypothetical protein